MKNFIIRAISGIIFVAIMVAGLSVNALAMVFLFTLEHDRPLAAALAGALYGFAAIRWGLASAIAAHVTTNLLLALHVIFSNSWAFW